MSTEDRIDHVIEAIDGALGDWSVSPDAMRWSPEPEEPPARGGLLSMATLAATPMVYREVPPMDWETRERRMQTIADAYDVPLCLAAGHAWGPEEVTIGVDVGPNRESVVNAYRSTCTRPGCGHWHMELRPGWMEAMRRW